MLGIATIDRLPNSSSGSVWVPSRVPGDGPTNVNAVKIEFDTDSEATKKVHALTRSRIVLVTVGTELAELPIEGEPLRRTDLEAWLQEIKSHQARILDAVKAYQARTGIRSLVQPKFPVDPNPRDFVPSEDTTVQRALMMANYAPKTWSVWLQTDEERRKRTIQPKTQMTPWIMPADMNEPSIPDFPASFATRLVLQPLT